ncbi:laccase domain protein YlmD [Lentibacillus kapialis]|uniref:Purine nucleoside phosphorylase n=1 Tax=Lentibacillus kapialis TaxID=340214 RepID=A0A917PQ15_9BACI|nr:peptidoglycan editing factor PgeF [Lentibacillus kapialis]GGJ86604.1 laccase domain protein YlmD [Lentibacillus kapialis]
MMEPFQKLTESTLELKKWQQMIPGLKAGFTTRNGGFSAPPFDTFNLGLHVPDLSADVISNRRKLADIVQMPLGSWVSGEQTHRTNIHTVAECDKGKGSTAYDTSLRQIDGLLTSQTGLLCTAFFADCVPIFFLDPLTGYIGIAHAGWQGTVHHIAQKMVERMQTAGADTADICVAIGPSISHDVYEVDERVINHIPQALFDKTVTVQGNNRFLLDLKQLNAEILLQQGVLRHNIDITNYCTFRDNQLFFSHRRDQGETGRMLGYIGYGK